jgi:ketosteroid isomerase-like protein
MTGGTNPHYATIRRPSAAPVDKPTQVAVATPPKAPEVKVPEPKPVEKPAPVVTPTPAPVPPVAVVTPPKAPEVKAPEVKAPEPKPVEKPAPVAPPAPVTPPKAPEVKAPEAKPAEKPVKDERNTQAETAVLATVNGWAKAWGDQNVKGYLGYYSDNFKTPAGVTRKAWAEERRARIEDKGHIDVKINAPTVRIEGNTATVRFRQGYTSNRLTVTSRKTLTLEKNGNKWLIVQEIAGR